jgi:hypothetical protein
VGDVELRETHSAQTRQAQAKQGSRDQPAASVVRRKVRTCEKLSFATTSSALTNHPHSPHAQTDSIPQRSCHPSFYIYATILILATQHASHVRPRPNRRIQAHLHAQKSHRRRGQQECASGALFARRQVLEAQGYDQEALQFAFDAAEYVYVVGRACVRRERDERLMITV